MPTIELPQKHPGQQYVYQHRKRYNVIQCGRRWGKTTFGEVIASEVAIENEPVGWFAPTYKYLDLVWAEIATMLKPILVLKNRQQMRMELVTGGTIDFWTMDSDDAGRGRKYKRVIIDEAGLVKNMLGIWQAAIRPTLTDLKGDAWFLGTPKGRREFHELFQRGEQGKDNWASFRRPTVDNPCIDPAEIEEARQQMLPQVFEQEYLGIPADDGGNPFGMSQIAACFGPVESAPVFVWGIDLAKSQDWTVATGLSASGHVVALHRFQKPWRDTMTYLAGVIGNTPALVDSTGVGDPIVEQLQYHLPSVEGFQFTSRSKQQIMEGLAYTMQHGEVRFHDQTMRSELESFGYEYTATGVRYSAPEGLHDDCVCSLALANEMKRRNPGVHVSTANVSAMHVPVHRSPYADTGAGWKPFRPRL